LSGTDTVKKINNPKKYYKEKIVDIKARIKINVNSIIYGNLEIKKIVDTKNIFIRQHILEGMNHKQVIELWKKEFEQARLLRDMYVTAASSERKRLKKIETEYKAYKEKVKN